MKKHKKINKKKENKKYKEINHIISQLYKIKEINRRKDYDETDIRPMIFTTMIGQKVKRELIEKKVTIQWLEDNGFNKVASVFKFALDE